MDDGRKWTGLHQSLPLAPLFIDTAHENTLISKARRAPGIVLYAFVNMLLVFVH